VEYYTAKLLELEAKFRPFFAGEAPGEAAQAAALFAEPDPGAETRGGARRGRAGRQA